MGGIRPTYKTHVEPFLKDIEKAWKQGATQKEIYTKLKVPRATFYDYKKRYPELSELFDPIAQADRTHDIVSELHNARLKLAKGFKYQETMTKTYEKGGKVISTTTEVYDKYQSPNARAITECLNRWDKSEIRDRAWHDMKRRELELKERSLDIQATGDSFIAGDMLETVIRGSLAPSFIDLFETIQNNDITNIDLIGGRGSTKSTFASLFILWALDKYPDMHAVCYRKVAGTLVNSVYDQLRWSIDQAGLTNQYKCTKSPLQITKLDTGQTIMFRGLDDPRKSKSIKVPFGYIGVTWFEEFDEFAGAEEIRSVQQSTKRGGDKFYTIKSMNPPRSNVNWANSYIEDERKRDNTIVSKTDYLTVPVRWLGQAFIDDAEHLKATNEKAYRHEYLGEIVGTGTEVFDNVEDRTITDDEIDTFDNIFAGIDWGYYPDPYHFGKAYYDSTRRDLYLYYEYRALKATNLDTIQYIKDNKLLLPAELVTCDSAEPKSIADYRANGLNARGAEKGPNSIREGIKWLQSLNHIYIDSTRCPHTFKEFSRMEYDINKDGEVLSTIPDKDNHSVDCTRYMLERVWKRRGM